MVLALVAGWALGTAGGVAAGAYVVPKLLKVEPKDYITAVDISADSNPDIPMPSTAGQPVNVFKKRLLRDTSPWLVHPDYDRVLFMNSILETLWPHLSPAIHKQVLAQAQQPLEDVCKQVGVLKEIRIDSLDLGTRPPRVDCFKSYETTEDELIIETPAFWGGDIKLRVSAVVKLGTYTIDVPVEVSNIQFKALSRVTIKPLVETLPCLGGVTLSLLETPHFNVELRIGGSPDLMALPFVPSLVGMAIKVVAGQMLVYPNEYALPLMPNFGLPPPPVGMLHVKVIRAKGLKGSLFDRMDAFVLAEVREGRPLKTKVIPNSESPEWNDEFDFVVDSPATQALRLVLKDDDLVGASTEGVAAVPLQEFMSRPRVPVSLTVPLRAPGDPSKVKHRHATGGSDSEAATPASGALPSPSQSGDTASSVVEGGKKRGFIKSGLSRLRHPMRRNKKVPPGATPSEAAELAVAEAVGGEVLGAGSPRPSDVGSAAAEEGEHDPAEVGSTPATPRLQLPAGALTGATVAVECTFFPFKASSREGVSVERPADGQPAQPAITSVRRTLMSTAAPDLASKGVLTVTLKKCTDLAGTPDSYAVVKLYDPNRLPIPDIEFRTDVVMNEDCPRYNFRRDFVNVSVASSLSVVIYEKGGTLDALKSLKVPFMQKGEDKVLGRLRLPVVEVAKEGRINDQWALLEAQTGDVHLTLEWNPVVVDGDAAGAR